MKRIFSLRLAAFVLVQLIVFSAAAQQRKKLPDNWFNLDLGKDSIFGVSTERTYNELLKDKSGKTVIVAVIDAGTDVNHEDLKNVIWTNPKEIAGNGIDDDHNGYVDDIHGWNFIGGKDSSVLEDTYEMTRLMRKYKAEFSSVTDPSSLAGDQKKDYAMFQKVKKDYDEQVLENSTSVSKIKDIMASTDRILNDLGGADKVTAEDLAGYKYASKSDSLAIVNLRSYLAAGMHVGDFQKQLQDVLNYRQKNLNYYLNLSYDPRPIVGDNYDDVTQHYYGNNTMCIPAASHGTHVAGIIAASRNNGFGINGIGDNVRIMVVRVVPDGDERDKDVANGIRYAVDNGASVINMSFGKSYAYNKAAVDEAVAYAEAHDVLLVHAAGNESTNTDKEPHYPNATLLNRKQKVSTWIEVGASGPRDNEYLAAPFSNYGKHVVDLFAPGLQINSTVPGSKYEVESGTSMASPTTAGVAAVLRSYFPDLTAQQVKEILMSTVTPVKHKVYIPGTKDKTKFSKLCVSGGVINLYNAVLMAEKTKGKKVNTSVSVN